MSCELTQKRIRCGVFHSVPELIDAVDQYISIYNEHRNSFVWTAKVEDNLRNVSESNAILVTVQ